MDRDFVYCPGCARYSIVQFKPELMGWECEDCTYTQPMDEEPVLAVVAAACLAVHFHGVAQPADAIVDFTNPLCPRH
jgi:hypothetical protein